VKRQDFGTTISTSIPISLPTRESTDTPLHHVITHIQKAVESREATLGAFPDIETAFDSTSFGIRKKAAK
jgi:hypothetical protein